MGKIYKNGIEYGGGGGDSAGHIILDNDGTAMTEEPSLQFKGLNVTDNSTDEVTEVESVGLNQDSMDDVLNASIPGNQVASNGLVYSTEEQVVGKWIDGKPIYQKTFTGTTDPTGNTDWNGTSPNRITMDVGAEVAQYVSASGFVISPTTGSTYPLNFFSFERPASQPTANYGEWTKLWVRTHANPSVPDTFVVATGDGSSVKNQPFIVTLQYTKVS